MIIEPLGTNAHEPLSDGSGERITPRVLFLDQTGHLGGAELTLATVVVRYSRRGAVTLFQDGPFRGMLERLNVPVSVCPLGARAAAASKASVYGSHSQGFAPFHILSVGFQVLRVALQVARQARKFDLIYANTAKALIIGGLAANLSGRPLLFHLHDIFSADHFSPFNRRLLLTFANRAQAIVAVSESVRRFFIDSGGRPELTRVVYNYVDARPYTETTAEVRAQERERARQELGIGEAHCVLMVGRLTPWKGQHLLLEALRTLPGVHAVLIGDALFTEEDRQYANRLKMEASKPDLAGRVHFLGFREDLPRWYGMADLVVHASTAPEPFGRVIVEGMLAGKTVIAARAGGATEILSDGKTGYFVTPNDSNEIANAIRAVLAAPEAASAMGARARAHARWKFSDEAALAAMDRIIDGLVCGREGKR